MKHTIKHIGIIMDGNRGWAKERGLPTFEGHRRGYENAKTILRGAKERSIPCVTLWALSDDNIKNRSKEEISYLFTLIAKNLNSLAKEAKEMDIRLVIIGNRELIRRDCLESIDRAEQYTALCTGMVALIAIAYGGQDEILRGVRSLAQSGADMAGVTREDIARHIETVAYPPPDLIIRTGGHMRHSGFLLFQSLYAEYFFSEKNWPDFTLVDLDTAMVRFGEAERKYGK